LQAEKLKRNEFGDDIEDTRRNQQFGTLFFQPYRCQCGLFELKPGFKIDVRHCTGRKAELYRLATSKKASYMCKFIDGIERGDSTSTSTSDITCGGSAISPKRITFWQCPELLETLLVLDCLVSTKFDVCAYKTW
jgi:hypothetical protein